MTDKKRKMISPSIMCVDFMKLGETLRVFEETGIEYIHVDIMDGSFVPNFTLGTDFCAQLKKNTRVPLDIHMMVEHPEQKLSWFKFSEGDFVSVHYESTPHIHRALTEIKASGAKAMVALNPGTPVSVLENLWDEIDGVLIMTVNPGFAGQRLVESTLAKIREVRAILDARGLDRILIEVDGNVSPENARKMRDAGADIYVAGTSSIFKKDRSLEEGIAELYGVIREGK